MKRSFSNSVIYIEPLNCQSSSEEMKGNPVVALDKLTPTEGPLARYITSCISIRYQTLGEHCCYQSFHIEKLLL